MTDTGAADASRGTRPAGCPSQLTIADAQAAVWDNKVRQGFDLDSIAEELVLLMIEVGEAADAWRRHRARRPGWFRRALAWLRIRPLPPAITDVRELRLEVADVILFALGVAGKAGFDAAAAVEDKLRMNAARVYLELPGGAHVRDRS